MQLSAPALVESRDPVESLPRSGLGHGATRSVDTQMRILQVSTTDVGGGAERVARNLFEAFRTRGQESCLAVGLKYSSDPDVLAISGATNRGVRGRRGGQALTTDIAPAGSIGGRFRRFISDPAGDLETFLGLENFRAPGTWHLLDLVPGGPPDVVHLHNLHGHNYFDLRALPWLSRSVPVVLQLHDGWLLSGHCAHSFGCERWATGCGRCPDLTIYPAIRRDATALNWRRKQRIYQRSHVWLVTPSKWLMERALRSMLAVAVTEATVIPNGVDLSLFHSQDRHVARAQLGLPADARVVLVIEGDPATNKWKDFTTVRSAIARLLAMVPGVMILAPGQPPGIPPALLSSSSIRWFGYTRDPQRMALYFRASDLYLHASHVDTFPLSILEALGCGTPVVATAVGGIPEQVKGLFGPGHPTTLHAYGAEEATGVLVEAGDAERMAVAAENLLKQRDLLRQLSSNAVRDVRARFDLVEQVDSMLEWYRRAMQVHKARPSS